MPVTNYELALVKAPSVGAVAYEALALREELLRINEREYPLECCKVRDVLLCLVEHLTKELEYLLDVENAKKVVPGDANVFKRVRNLSDIIHQCYSYLRYLKASSRLQTPPVIQLVIAGFLKSYLPKGVGEPICLVRPQWRYKVSCVLLSWYLKNHLLAGKIYEILDPRKKLNATDGKSFMSALWNEYAERCCPTFKKHGHPPENVAIISFAGLDTHDVLFYPLLVHELAHVMDFSIKPLNLDPRLNLALKIPRSKVEAILGNTAAPAQFSKVHTGLIRRAYVCALEILADLLSIRMTGLAYFFTIQSYLKLLTSDWPGPAVNSAGYPGIKLRLSIIFAELTSEKDASNPALFFEQHGTRTSARFILRYLGRWSAELEHPSTLGTVRSIGQDTSIEAQLDLLLENAIRSSLATIREVAEEKISKSTAAKLEPSFFERISLLRNDMPPSATLGETGTFAEILAAAWTYQLQYGEEAERDLGTLFFKSKEYQKTCRLVLKAIELSVLPEQLRATLQKSPLISRQPSRSELLSKRGVLDKISLKERISLNVGRKERIGIIPVTSGSVEYVSVNLHLGNWFSIARKTRVQSFEIEDPDSRRLLESLGREEIFIPYLEPFLIHPGDLVLGVSMEFLSLPADMMAYVDGKSRIGRTGLIIATASKVDPGFHGCIVLELANSGTVPLQVRPGNLIGQLVFHQLRNELPRQQLYRGPYYCQIKP